MWWSSWVAAVAPYAVLLELFNREAMSADEFELVFLKLYEVDPTDWPPDLFEILEGVFADVDEFCADPLLRERVGGLDAHALRRRCGAAFERLSELAG